MLPALVAALIFSTAAASQVDLSACAAFTALADGGIEPSVAVSQAYRDFFEKLGGQRLSDESLAKLTESGDPFTLPEQKDADLFALQTNLAKFRELVTARGWNTQPIRENLLKVLADLIADRQSARQTTAKAARENQSNFTLPKSLYDVGVSGDGTWLVTADREILTVFHVPTRTMKTYPNELGRQRLVIAPDATELLFATESEDTLARVPLRDGVPIWSKHELITSGYGVAQNTKPVFFGGKGNNFFYSTPMRGELQRTDLKTGITLRISSGTLPKLNGQKVVQWQSIPGTDDLSLLVTHGAGAAFLRTASVTKTGDIVSGENMAQWEPTRHPHNKLVWSRDGKAAFVFGASGGLIEMVRVGNTTPVTLFSEAKNGKAFENIIDVATNSAGPRGAILHKAKGQGDSPFNGDHVQLFDTSTGKPLGKFKLPFMANKISFAANGEYLIVKSDSEDTLVVNYQSRL